MYTFVNPEPTTYEDGPHFYCVIEDLKVRHKGKDYYITFEAETDRPLGKVGILRIESDCGEYEYDLDTPKELNTLFAEMLKDKDICEAMDEALIDHWRDNVEKYGG